MQLIKSLKEYIDKPLAGHTPHYKLMQDFRRKHPHVPGPESRKAAVLVLLFPRQDDWHTVFIRRKLESGVTAHRGQISLPGGKREPGDPDLQVTALRESHEEIGIDPAKVGLIGQLSELFIPVSDFHVHPFVGYLNFTPAFRAQESEVDEVLSISLDKLRDPANLKRKDIQTPTGVVLRDVPYLDLNGETLWGATAMIIAEFIELLETAQPRQVVGWNA